jgi:hypothetical protein
MSNSKSKRSPLLPRCKAITRSTITRGNKHLRHRLPLSSDAMMIHLAPTEYVQETSSGTSSATALKCTTLRKPTWEPLLPP